MPSPSLPRPPYRPLRHLGEGRSGIVLEVQHPSHPSPLALKLFSPLPCPALARMQADFDELRRLSHPNLVHLHDFSSNGDRAQLAMELVRGLDLIRFVRGRAPSETGAQAGMLFGQVVQRFGESAFSAARESAAISRLRLALTGLARGLSALHARSRVHGDVRPSNVLVCETGRAVLIDLLSEHAPSDPARFAGTAAYMAPEHGLGAPAAPPSDMYSFGVLLFEALTGELPFDGSGREVFVRKNTVSAPRPGLLVSGLPEDLDELCARLLDRRPSARPTAEAALAWLETPPREKPRGM